MQAVISLKAAILLRRDLRPQNVRKENRIKAQSAMKVLERWAENKLDSSDEGGVLQEFFICMRFLGNKIHECDFEIIFLFFKSTIYD